MHPEIHGVAISRIDLVVVGYLCDAAEILIIAKWAEMPLGGKRAFHIAIRPDHGALRIGLGALQAIQLV